MNKEIWKDIKGYEGLYQINNYGIIKSLPKQDGFYYLKEKILKPVNNNGYLRIILSKNGIKKNYFIHRLVAEAFLPNFNNYPIINHKDGNKRNNCVDNLEWTTNKKNTEHAVRNNLIKHYKIAQYNKSGNLIKIYDSRYDIKNIDSSSITRVCNGVRKSAGGYVWKYVD